MKFKAIFILFLTALPFTSLFAKLPEKFIGNWIDAKSSEWTYGFFEDFAVYQSDFWEYQSIETGKDGRTTVQLKKGQEQAVLTLVSKKDSSIQVRSGNGKTVRFSRVEKSLPSFSKKDMTSFAKPTFRKDSVTIVGYYRNLDKIPAQFANRLNRSPFNVGVPSFQLDKSQDYLADIDSIGRFRITFPVMNMQELFVDWGRIGLSMVVESGDQIFLFADMLDYLPQTSDSSYEMYISRPKQLLFMGDNARLNNELFQYKNLWKSFGTINRKEKSDMTFLRAQDTVYLQKLEDLNDYAGINQYLSEKARFFISEHARWRMAFDLMQRRFSLREREKPIFEEAYMDFVRATFPLDNELCFTGFRDFGTFLRDYLGYTMEGGAKVTVNLTYGMIADHVKNDSTIDNQTKALLVELDKMSNEFKDVDSAKAVALQVKYKDLFQKAQAISPLLQRVASEIINGRGMDTKMIDSLLINPNLRDLWLTKTMHSQLDANHLPFTAAMLNSFKKEVKNPDLIAEVVERTDFYEGVRNKTVSFESSLKNTSHLSEYGDADSLFKALIAPYLGKVIYVDFWGTWCGPCKENMKYSKALKGLLKGKEVVFMYFANNSPEESWKSIIQEYELTGENVVQYRLPNNQQSMIERKFSVKSFPTYMLIDMEGHVVNTSAMHPMQTEDAAKQILELLK